MQTDQTLSSRRGFLKTAGLGAAAMAASQFYQPGAFAQELQRTAPDASDHHEPG